MRREEILNYIESEGLKLKEHHFYTYVCNNKHLICEDEFTKCLKIGKNNSGLFFFNYSYSYKLLIKLRLL